MLVSVFTRWTSAAGQTLLDETVVGMVFELLDRYEKRENLFATSYKVLDIDNEEFAIYSVMS